MKPITITETGIPYEQIKKAIVRGQITVIRKGCKGQPTLLDANSPYLARLNKSVRELKH